MTISFLLLTMTLVLISISLLNGAFVLGKHLLSVRAPWHSQLQILWLLSVVWLQKRMYPSQKLDKWKSAWGTWKRRHQNHSKFQIFLCKKIPTAHCGLQCLRHRRHPLHCLRESRIRSTGWHPLRLLLSLEVVPPTKSPFKSSFKLRRYLESAWEGGYAHWLPPYSK